MPHMHVHLLVILHEFILSLKVWALLKQHWSFEKDLRSCMSCLRIVLEKLVWNWVWLNTLGLWFLKLSFESCLTMSLQMFSGNLAQEVEFWCFWTWFLAWRCNLEFPDFALPLERGKSRSSGESEHPVSLHCFTVCSSEGLGAQAESCVSSSSGRRAEISPIQYFYSTLERKILRSSVYLCCMTARAGETWARAGLCFSENSWNCFLITSLHPYLILGILRPSLRHLNEDIDVEHTEAN